jgi:hypothetical protein
MISIEIKETREVQSLDRFGLLFFAIIAMFKRILIVAVIAAASAAAGHGVRASTSLSFDPLVVNVKEGQTFRVSIGVNPNGTKDYTVKTSIKFPADLVTLKTWTYAEDWMPLRKSGYDYFNNTTGILIRTAGYPDGFDRITNFGSAIFEAKKNGVGIIEFAGDSLALDENSFNQYAGGNQLSLVISPLLPVEGQLASSTPPNIVQTEPAPNKLFDISLELDQYSVSDISDLGARVDFYSFGNVPTPVDITFDILDYQGDVVHSEKDNITVQTEKIDNKKFTGFKLPSGQYVLRVTTIYNNNVRDEFKQPFEISAVGRMTARTPLLWPYLAVLGMILLLLILIFLEIKKSNDREKFRDKWKKIG